MKVNKENIEEQILLYVDGELDAAAEGELMDFLQKYPEYDALLQDYLSTVLHPEEALLFPGKEHLLRQEARVTPFVSIKTIRIAAAAAGIIAVGSLLLFLNSNNNTVQPADLAGINPERTVRTTGKPALLAKENKPVPVAPLPVAAALPAQQSSRNHSLTDMAKHVPVAEERTKHVVAAVTLMEGVSVAREEQPFIAAEIRKPVMLPASNTVPEQDAEEELKGWGPFKGENLQGVNDLIAHIQTIKEKVESKAAMIKKTCIRAAPGRAGDRLREK
jgi:cell pole-organizing protein PopZ